MKIILACVLLGFIALAVESRNVITKHGERIQLTGTISEEERAKVLEKFPFSNPESRIKYGQRAAYRQFPWQVWLYLAGSNGAANCGGTLVTGNHIITAAHCMPAGVNAVNAYFDSIDRNSFPTVEGADWYAIHHGWESAGAAYLEHDITILHIVNSVPYARASLPTRASNDQTYEGYWMTASGFGGDETGSITQFLMFTSMIIHAPHVCNNYNMLCAAGSGNSMLGGGDSGGPLSQGNTLYGVISFSAGNVNGFTRVDRYLDWIGQYTGLPIYN